jgi:hypothetical protein
VNNTLTKNKRQRYEINGILEKKNGVCASYLKNSVHIFVEKIHKMEVFGG